MAWISPLLVSTVVAALSLAACEEAGGPNASPAGPTTPLAPVGFQTIDMGDQSGIVLEQPQVFTLDGEDRWADFWARHKAGVVPMPDLPAVDFSSEMVIAVVDRAEPSGGFSYEITEIEEEGGRLVVHVRKDVPGQDCVVTAVITQPYHIVRAAKSELPLELAISEETVSCG